MVIVIEFSAVPPQFNTVAKWQEGTELGASPQTMSDDRRALLR